MKPINLKHTDLGMVMPPMGVNSTDGEDAHYPRFHYEGDKELDLPKEGTMTISYCVPKTVSTEDKDGKHYYACDVVVKEILAVKKAVNEAPYRDTSTEDALDKLVKEREEEESDDDSADYEE